MSLAFAFVWGVLLLPLPLLVRRLPAARIDTAALWIPFFAGLDQVHDTPARQPVPRRAAMAWVLLVLAVTQPVISISSDTWPLYRPFLLAALVTAMSAGLRLTRKPRVTRRLPSRYHRDDTP